VTTVCAVQRRVPSSRGLRVLRADRGLITGIVEPRGLVSRVLWLCCELWRSHHPSLCRLLLTCRLDLASGGNVCEARRFAHHPSTWGGAGAAGWTSFTSSDMWIRCGAFCAAQSRVSCLIKTTRIVPARGGWRRWCLASFRENPGKVIRKVEGFSLPREGVEALELTGLWYFFLPCSFGMFYMVLVRSRFTGRVSAL